MSINYEYIPFDRSLGKTERGHDVVESVAGRVVPGCTVVAGVVAAEVVATCVVGGVGSWVVEVVGGVVGRVVGSVVGVVVGCVVGPSTQVYLAPNPVRVVPRWPLEMKRTLTEFPSPRRGSGAVRWQNGP